MLTVIAAKNNKTANTKNTNICFCILRSHAFSDDVCPVIKFPMTKDSVVAIPSHAHSRVVKKTRIESRLALQPLNTPMHIPPPKLNKAKFTSVNAIQTSDFRDLIVLPARSRRSKSGADLPKVLGAVALGGSGGMSEKNARMSNNEVALIKK